MQTTKVVCIPSRNKYNLPKSKAIKPKPTNQRESVVLNTWQYPENERRQPISKSAYECA
jgi:hypothetical protein